MQSFCTFCSHGLKIYGTHGVCSYPGISSCFSFLGHFFQRFYTYHCQLILNTLTYLVENYFSENKCQLVEIEMFLESNSGKTRKRRLSKKKCIFFENFPNRIYCHCNKTNNQHFCFSLENVQQSIYRMCKLDGILTQLKLYFTSKFRFNDFYPKLNGFVFKFMPIFVHTNMIFLIFMYL